MRLSRVRALTAAVGACALVTAALTAPVATAAPAAPPATTTAYYVAKPVCSAVPHPSAGTPRAHCLAQRRVKATKSTPHARKVVRARNHADYGPAGGFTPDDLATAYGVDNEVATTRTVAVIGAYNYPTARKDLQAFDDVYGIDSDESYGGGGLDIVNQRGTSEAPIDDGQQKDENGGPGDYGWSLEAALDLQAVRGLCHHCKILFVEADDSDLADFATAVDLAYSKGARIISNSYGTPESAFTDSQDDIDYLNELSKAYFHPGAIITASTGDDGMYDWDYVNYTPQSSEDQKPTPSASPNFPSSLGTVVSVGGTSLQLNPDSTRSGETVWNTNGQADLTGYAAGASLGATGGGCSTQTPVNTWQYYLAGWSETGCDKLRLPADVSVDGDPFTGYDIHDSFNVEGVNTCNSDDQTACWATLGGTSLSAPLIAAMWATAGGSNLRWPAETLYAHSKSAPGAINDVTYGGNGYCGGLTPDACASQIGGSPDTQSGAHVDCGFDGDYIVDTTRSCDATTGYDGPSGVGTPHDRTLFTTFYPRAVQRKAGAIAHGRAANFSAAGSSDPYPGGRITGYAWNWGDGTSVNPGSANQAHTFARAGRYTVLLKVTDNTLDSSGHYLVRYASQVVTVK